MVEDQVLDPFATASGVAGDDPGPVEHLDRLGADQGVEAPAGIGGPGPSRSTGAHRPGLAVDPEVQRRVRVEGLGRQRAQERAPPAAKCSPTVIRRPAMWRASSFRRRLAQMLVQLGASADTSGPGRGGAGGTGRPRLRPRPSREPLRRPACRRSSRSRSGCAARRTARTPCGPGPAAPSRRRPSGCRSGCGRGTPPKCSKARTWPSKNTSWASLR